MTKIFIVVLLGAALVGCNARTGEEPVLANGSTTLTPQYNTQYSPNVEVTIYKDPGGCQYLVFNDLGYSSTVAVVPRIHADHQGACVSSDTP